MRRLFGLVFLCFLIWFSVVSNVFAVDYFTEDFTTSDSTVWNYFCDYYDKSQCGVGSTNITYSNSSITLGTYNSDFPVVLSKVNIFPSNGDFSVKVGFRYPSVTNRGVGLGIGFTGPAPYNKLFSQFGIWQDSSSGQNFKFYYNDFSTNSSQGYCSDFTNSTDDKLGRQTVTNIQLSRNFWHLLEIYRVGDFYYVYIDRNLNTSPIFTTEIKNNCIPKIIWFGNFNSDSGGAWTTFSLDNIVVSSDTFIETPTPTLVLTPTPTITPTPSPIPTSIPIPTATPTEVVRKKKIFILPGLGASWNSKAIVYGQSVGDNEWEMTPFVNNYNGVIELMEKNGLEKDKDYFVWNYDWRKNIANIETDFDEYVKSKNLSSGDDIYLIGHSLGGVVARLWAQDNNSENVKKIIELGSPNLGSLDSYSVWNGGKIMKSSGLSSVAFNIILGLQNKGFVLTDLNKIRNFVPIVKDLLPVFDYAVKGSKTMSWNTMESHNDFLNSQNVNVSILGSKLKFFVGVGVSTPSKVSLVNRSFVSKTLGLWPDGEIKDYIYSNGDGTVLSTSVNMGLSNFLEFNSTHGEIVAKSISEVADEIGFLNKSISFGYSDNFSDGLVIFVGSPVTSFLKCGSETYQEDDGFIVVKNKNYGDCELNLSPTDNGVVHVVLGNTSTNKWNYFEKEVTLNNPEKIKIDYKKAGIKIDASNKQVLKDQIKSDLEKLGLNKAIKFLDKNDFGKVAWYIFEYRKQNNERIVSQRVLNNLFIYGSIISPDRIKGNYKWLGMYIDLVDKTLEVKSKRKNISQNSISSLVWLKNLEDSISGMIKDKKYPDYQLTAMMVFGYGGEAVRN